MEESCDISTGLSMAILTEEFAPGLGVHLRLQLSQIHLRERTVRKSRYTITLPHLQQLHLRHIT
jgi:hypothetical protein